MLRSELIFKKIMQHKSNTTQKQQKQKQHKSMDGFFVYFFVK